MLEYFILGNFYFINMIEIINKEIHTISINIIINVITIKNIRQRQKRKFYQLYHCHRLIVYTPLRLMSILSYKLKLHASLYIHTYVCIFESLYTFCSFDDTYNFQYNHMASLMKQNILVYVTKDTIYIHIFGT